jgi:ketosteroid isomerase-like protein
LLAGALACLPKACLPTVVGLLFCRLFVAAHCLFVALPADKWIRGRIVVSQPLQGPTMRAPYFVAYLSFAALASATSQAADDRAVAEQVRSAERAFAATMADRNQAAFREHIAEEAVFFDGEKAVRGKAAVVAAWQAFFERSTAPFSWEPETVQVLDSGTLAHSSGPVFNPEGKRVGTFNSVWRRETDGKWRVVFDKGCDACNCAAAKSGGG